MLGKSSRVMIRRWLSPLTSAAAMKSRWRSIKVWARSTRAFHAQPVTTSTKATVIGPAGRYAAITIASGSPGSTRNTLMISDSTLSTRPPK